jgi:hypothetical protein
VGAPADGASIPRQEDRADAGDARADDAGPIDEEREAGDDEVLTPTAACVTYCDTLMGACAGDFLQFPTKTACLRACAYYPPGMPGDATGNSLTCRQQHADSAVGHPEHCHHAGPYGFDGCGSSCEGLCQLAMGWCAGSAGGPPFASTAECATACASFQPAPPLAGGVTPYSANGPTSGDTLECREYELAAALSSIADRDVHCPRAGASSSTCR